MYMPGDAPQAGGVIAAAAGDPPVLGGVIRGVSGVARGAVAGPGAGNGPEASPEAFRWGPGDAPRLPGKGGASAAFSLSEEQEEQEEGGAGAEAGAEAEAEAEAGPATSRPGSTSRPPSKISPQGIQIYPRYLPKSKKLQAQR